MFLHHAMILLADSHDVSLVKSIRVAYYFMQHVQSLASAHGNVMSLLAYIVTKSSSFLPNSVISEALFLPCFHVFEVCFGVN